MHNIVSTIYNNVAVDEQTRQDNDTLGATRLHTLLQSIRQHGMPEAIFEQHNSRAINNRLDDIPNDVFDLATPVFIVPRHSFIDIIINREIVPFK